MTLKLMRNSELRLLWVVAIRLLWVVAAVSCNRCLPPPVVVVIRRHSAPPTPIGVRTQYREVFESPPIQDISKF